MRTDHLANIVCFELLRQKGFRQHHHFDGVKGNRSHRCRPQAGLQLHANVSIENLWGMSWVTWNEIWSHLKGVMSETSYDFSKRLSKSFLITNLQVNIN